MIEIEARCEFVDLKPWTVGTHQKMLCHWERSAAFSQPFVLKFAREEDQYSLVLLETQSGDKQLEAVVTGYKPGPHKEVSFAIVSGDVKLMVVPMSWNIETTIKQQQGQQQQEQQQPVPSYGPFMLPFPTWILWTFVVLLTVAIGTGIYGYIRRRQKKIFQKRLEEYLHKGSPHLQVHAALRAMVRLLDGSQKSKAEFLNEMDILLKQYLMGTFALPVEGLSARSLIKRLASRSERWSKDLKIQFRQTVFDLERLKEQPEALTAEDLTDLISKLRQLIDQIQFQRGRK